MCSNYGPKELSHQPLSGSLGASPLAAKTPQASWPETEAICGCKKSIDIRRDTISEILRQEKESKTGWRQRYKTRKSFVPSEPAMPETPAEKRKRSSALSPPFSPPRPIT
ncbi:Signal Transducer And Activator Of Transcription 2 [Manis pentadactyla]|nr:Signal Transducer And Activator Of Transcription 2 [Manis pentadactyla]